MGQAKAKTKGKATLKPVKPVKLAPRTNDPERTMANLIEVASHAFSEKGLAGARIDVIADAMKTSKRMIYCYFDSKEGLYTKEKACLKPIRILRNTPQSLIAYP